ncbi:MAG: hypothetical protein QOC56_448 [Alphaproteobacteria bacterium]|nr:hypothetical protein [Alphaproteobacteria bacterium]
MKHERTQPRAGRAGFQDPTGPRFLIEDVFPCVDCGRFPVKRIAGEAVDVWADIFRDGHEVIAAALLWRAETESTWRREPMNFHENDRWRGRFVPPSPGRYLYALEAWTGQFATWRRDVLRKREAGQDVALEGREGCELLGQVSRPAAGAGKLIAQAKQSFEATADLDILLADNLAAAMAAGEPRADLTRSAIFPLIADRPLARAGAWYEMVPRSQSREPGRHGTFDDAIARLPEIAAMGFDVVYLTPIHPIGRTNRKGRNNALQAAPGDPGSPYAIGGPEGGHDAVHPDLGTLDDFRRFLEACRAHGIEVALDFAIQCSPDHPWLAEHPEWFKRRPDGSIRFAENPPKKYEDIINPDFYCGDRIALWEALRGVVLFWAERGVRIFRVDNPHTKPFAFWEWLIREVQSRHSDVIFLSEAFTRPKVMKGLAKLGFTQSYTYFTWRTAKDEIQAYLSELTRYPEREFFRPNFFVSTPDILPIHLQSGDPAMFKARLALAATLSSNYGILNGFELIEHEPIAGKEEYLNSEKYEIKVRDWNKPGNIKDYIARLNRLRRENPALLQTADLRFVTVDDGEIIGFVKESVTRDNAVAVAISVNGRGPRQFWFHFGDLLIGPDDDRRPVRVIENLFTHERHMLEWGGVRLSIGAGDPLLLFRCHR